VGAGGADYLYGFLADYRGFNAGADELQHFRYR
jgi:hypothetical protein